MTRKTLEQRKAEQQARKQAEFESYAEHWQNRLMTALSQLNEIGSAELTVTPEQRFKVTWFDQYNDREMVELPLRLAIDTYWQAGSDLSLLESEIRQRIEAREEAERQTAIKARAMAKLDDEERKALGLA